MTKNCMKSLLILILIAITSCAVNKEEFRLKAKEMFMHAFNSYMKYAYPADELMPLSCSGRYRILEKSRGDIDDILGNYSLTLIDSLDTLYLMNELKLFEESTKLVINNVKFDANVTVSVFEVNIRIIGGLLGAHIAAENLKSKGPIKNPNNHSELIHFMSWYDQELLWMADDVAKRLLPAFDTPTGIPYPRINLKYGHTSSGSNNLHDISTCTACAGTMILEFAALSRLTGNPIYEEKATNTMNYIWEQRNRFSNLVGTTINIHNGNWLRRDSGLGAGIDSYYEYLLKAYVLLGNDTYLHRFTVHYDAIKRYISTTSQSSHLPLLLDVNMHQPLQKVKNFMDSLLAFWPGLQVLFGDIKQAVAIHEILFQVMKRHNFLPEAFTTDFHVYWGYHLLRPEFLESNYFLYHSTGDSYYLDIGVRVLNNLESHTRVKCGFAAIKDVRTMNLSDQMDSFVLAETFKYLYLLFAEPHHLPINMDDYIFTTEGHILPLNLALTQPTENSEQFESVANENEGKSNMDKSESKNLSSNYKLCENHMLNADTASIINWVFLSHAPPSSSPSNVVEDYTPPTRQRASPIYRSPAQHLAASIREPLRDIVQRGGVPYPTNTHQDKSTSSSSSTNTLPYMPLLPKNLLPNNPEHVNMLKKMGIQIHSLEDGRIQLYHQPNMAVGETWANIGEAFMAEMFKISQGQENNLGYLFVTVLVNQTEIVTTYKAAPAQFGQTIKSTKLNLGLLSFLVIAKPYDACVPLENDPELLENKIVIAGRGGCMFIEKARNIEKTKAAGALIIDSVENSEFDRSAIFSMSGDGTNDVNIPVVFVFHKEGMEILKLMADSTSYPNVSVLFSNQTYSHIEITNYLHELQRRKEGKTFRKMESEDISLSEISHSRIDLHFQRTTESSSQTESDTNNKPDLKLIKDLPRLEISKVIEQDYDNLDQFLIRIYPNEYLAEQYKEYDRNRSVFKDSVIGYIKRYTNIDQLLYAVEFYSILDWAILFNINNEVSSQLSISAANAINILKYVQSNLVTKKYGDDPNDIYKPSKSHSISFDLIIYLTNKTDTKNSNNSTDFSNDSDIKNSNDSSGFVTKNSDNDNNIEHSEL